MDIRLMKLKLHNFKCYKEETFNFEGNDTLIHGENGEGKTTVLNSFLWCMTGKDIDGKTDTTSIRPIGEPVEVCPCVEATLAIDGEETVFTRELQATYTGRGADKTYKGDATVCTIDSVPKSVTEFNEYVAKIFPVNVSVWLDLAYFADDAKFSADDRRKVLVECFGKVTDEDVKMLNYEYEELFNAKGKLSVEDFKIAQKEVEKNCTTELGRGKTMGTLQARIDEAAKSIIHPELSVAEQEKKIADLTKQIKTASRGDDIAEQLGNARRELMRAESEAEQDIERRKNALFDEIDTKLVSLFSKRLKIEGNGRNTASEIEFLSQTISANNVKISAAKDSIERLEKEEAKYDTICPTCGQPIPQEQIDEIVGNFNENKAVRIEEYEDEINKLEEANSKALVEKESHEKVFAAFKESYEEVKADIEELNAKRKELESTPIGITEEQAKKIAELSANVEALKTALSMQGTSERLADLTAQLKAEQSKLAEAQANERQRERIKELRARQAEVAEMLSNAQRYIALCDSFIIDKAKFIERSISEHFTGVTFKLFDFYKNGEIKNACVPMVDGKPYRLLSFSQKILASVAILKGLSAHYAFTAPVFVDNCSELDANSIAKLDTAGQKIIIKVDNSIFTYEVL